jgi:hypothetical protein
MRQIPLDEPKEFATGETLTWRMTLPDFPPADGWTLTYYLRAVGGGFTQAAAVDGNTFLVTVPSTATTGLTPGPAALQGWVSKGSEKYQIVEMAVTIRQGLPSEDVAANYDPRSTAQKLLDAIDAILLDPKMLKVKMYTIAGRTMEWTSKTDLLALRKQYAQIVARERRAQRIKNGAPLLKPIYARFNRPS